jgi:hypothetical protein
MDASNSRPGSYKYSVLLKILRIESRVHFSSSPCMVRLQVLTISVMNVTKLVKVSGPFVTPRDMWVVLPTGNT